VRLLAQLQDSRSVSARRVRAARPDNRNQCLMYRGAGSPHPALRATFSRREKDWSKAFPQFGCVER
jgi:hypothetical protein